MKKICTVCNKEKPVEEFAPTGYIGKRNGKCRECVSALRKAYRQKNYDRMRTVERKRDSLRRVARAGGQSKYA